MIRVLVTGAAGRMGREAALALAEASDLEQVGAVDTVGIGETVAEGIVVLRDLNSALADTKPDVLFDVTHFSAAVPNAIAGLNSGAHVVIGTSGIDDAGRAEIALASERAGRAALIVPNFALGAVLMMAFAEQAAKWMPNAEIIERHGNHKKDAPSGTATETAARIARARSFVPDGIPGEEERIAGSRGGNASGVHVHSLRLSGSVAHQEVLFGGTGEMLTIRHDSLDRSSFRAGIQLACRGVGSLKGLVVGLDGLLFNR